MPTFSFGMISVAFAVLMPLAWLLLYQVRRLGAWSKRTEGPKDRVGFFVVLMAIIGLISGSFAQPLWNKAVECKAMNLPLGVCLFSNGNA